MLIMFTYLAVLAQQTRYASIRAFSKPTFLDSWIRFEGFSTFRSPLSQFHCQHVVALIKLLPAFIELHLLVSSYVEVKFCKSIVNHFHLTYCVEILHTYVSLLTMRRLRISAITVALLILHVWWWPWTRWRISTMFIATEFRFKLLGGN